MNAGAAAPKDRHPTAKAAAKRLTREGTPTHRQAPAPTPPPPIVVAIVTEVVGGREGTTRSLLVWRCPICGGGVRHLSQARGDLPPTVRRRGPHGLVLLYVVGAAVAAA